MYWTDLRQSLYLHHPIKNTSGTGNTHFRNANLIVCVCVCVCVCGGGGGGGGESVSAG